MAAGSLHTRKSRLQQSCTCPLVGCCACSAHAAPPLATCRMDMPGHACASRCTSPGPPAGRRPVEYPVRWSPRPPGRQTWRRSRRGARESRRAQARGARAAPPPPPPPTSTGRLTLSKACERRSALLACAGSPLVGPSHPLSTRNMWLPVYAPSTRRRKMCCAVTGATWAQMGPRASVGLAPGAATMKNKPQRAHPMHCTSTCMQGSDHGCAPHDCAIADTP